MFLKVGFTICSTVAPKSEENQTLRGRFDCFSMVKTKKNKILPRKTKITNNLTLEGRRDQTLRFWFYWLFWYVLHIIGFGLVYFGFY